MSAEMWLFLVGLIVGGSLGAWWFMCRENRKRDGNGKGS